METLQYFIYQWELRPTGAGCFEQPFYLPCSHKFFAYHLCGQLTACLLGIDVLTAVMLATIFVIESSIADWTNFAAPIYATVCFIVGLSFGTLLRRICRIDVPTARFIYDIPIVKNNSTTISRSKGWIFITYLGYLALSLSPLVSFFMSDLRIDSDVVDVPSRYILSYCLQVRRYESTGYYPLGLQMSEILHGLVMFAAIVVESKVLSYVMKYIPEKDTISRKIYHSILIYTAQIVVSLTYTEIAMVFRIDVFWIYLICILINAIEISIIVPRIRQIIVNYTGRLTNLRHFVCCLVWPCFRRSTLNAIAHDGGDGTNKKQ
jgi:hypothetical protein